MSRTPERIAQEEKPLSVGEYIGRINEALEALRETVIGEVSEAKVAPSGHLYFTLKDKDTGDILPCAMWKFKYQYCGVELEQGMEVVVKGAPNFSGRFGRLSLVADSVSLVGEGALKKAYDALKKKLAAEGLFDASRKRPLPAFVRTIGVVTSVHGAVIHDFSNNLRRSGFKVRILDCRVEGPECGRQLALSVRAMRTEPIDVLVLIRGGGSMQSLAGFDNEALVREIARFPVPVLAGIGHHQDAPLAALVADAAESTPSLVAALLGASWQETERALERSERHITDAYATLLSDARRDIARAYSAARESLGGIVGAYAKATSAVTHGMENIAYRLKDMERDLQREGERTTRAYRTGLGAATAACTLHVPARIIRGWHAMIQRAGAHIAHAHRLIQRNDPSRRLALGYSIAHVGDKVVRSTRDVAAGETLRVKVSDGVILSTITGIDNNYGEK